MDWLNGTRRDFLNLLFFTVKILVFKFTSWQVKLRASEILKLLDSQVETIDPSNNDEKEAEVLKKLIKEEISGPRQLSIIDFFAEEEKEKEGKESSVDHRSQEAIESYNKLCKIISNVNLDNMSIIEIQELIQELKREINCWRFLIQTYTNLYILRSSLLKSF